MLLSFSSDVDIVRNLTETVKRQQEAAYLKASGFKDGKLAYGEKKEGAQLQVAHWCVSRPS